MNDGARQANQDAHQERLESLLREMRDLLTVLTDVESRKNQNMPLGATAMTKKRIYDPIADVFVDADVPPERVNLSQVAKDIREVLTRHGIVPEQDGKVPLGVETAEVDHVLVIRQAVVSGDNEGQQKIRIRVLGHE